MAYISKAEVQIKTAQLKVLNGLYGVKSTFSGSNSSSLLLTISSSGIDFIGNHIEMLKIAKANGRIYYPIEDSIEVLKISGYIQVNNYYLKDNFSGTALEYLESAYKIMLEGHWDKSDVQTDYFNCSWYNNIHVGRWNKPYVLTAE